MRRLSTRWPYAVFLLANLVLHAPLFFGRIVFARDRGYWNIPVLAWLRQSFIDGDFGHWNPLQALGISTWSNPQHALVYPLNWPVLLLPSDGVAWFVTLQSSLHVGIATWGMASLARRLQLSHTAAAVSVTVFALGGVVSSLWTVGVLLASAAWLPWIGCTMVGLAQASTPEARMRGVGAVGFATALAVLGGDVFAAAMGVLFGVGVSAASHWELHRSNARAWRDWSLTLGAATVLASMCVAVTSLPATAQIADTSRSGSLPLREAELHSLHPARLLETVAAGAMGDPYGDYPAASVVGEAAINGRTFISSCYLGVLAVLLAALGFLPGALSITLLAMAALALTVAMGHNTPVHAWLRWLPPFSMMRYPEKYLLLVAAPLALLAGMGSQRLLLAVQSGFSLARWWRGGTTALGLLMVAAAGASRVLGPAWAVPARSGLLTSCVLVLAFLAVLALAKRKPSWTPAALILLVVCDMGWGARGQFPYVESEIANEIPPAAVRIAAHSQHPIRVYRAPQVNQLATAWSTRYDSPLAVDAAMVQTLAPNTTLRAGIGSVPGYDAAVPKILHDLWHTQSQAGLNIVRLLSVDYVLLPWQAGQSPGVAPDGMTTVVDVLPTVRLFAVQQPLPRAYVAGSVQPVSNEALVSRLVSDEVTSGKVALVDHVNLAVHGDGNMYPCEPLAFSNNHLAVRCNAVAGGLVVFVHQFAPGWHAAVDGVPTEIMRTNGFMRGLAVTEGSHYIEMHYRPPWVRIGGLISIVGGVLCALLLMGQRKQRPSRRNEGIFQGIPHVVTGQRIDRVLAGPGSPQGPLRSTASAGADPAP